MKQLITLSNPLITLKSTSLPKTHLKNLIISSKWGKRRPKSTKSLNKKLIFNAITVASNLNIIPKPLDTLVRELWVVSGGGNGGKFGFITGFGGGGGGGNWGRKKLGFWGILVILVGVTMWVLFEKELENDLCGVWVLCVGFGLFCVGYWLWRKGFRGLVFGFCFGVVLMGLGFRNGENFGKLVDRFRASFGSLGVVSKKRGFRRWSSR